MQQDDSFLKDNGEFQVFIRETERELAKASEPSLAEFNDSFWKNFTAQCERDAAARELGFESEESAPLHAPRLRSERSEDDGEDFSKSAGVGRRHLAIREWFKQALASGESAADLIKYAEANSPSTAATMRAILAEGL